MAPSGNPRREKVVTTTPYSKTTVIRKDRNPILGPPRKTEKVKTVVNKAEGVLTTKSKRVRTQNSAMSAGGPDMVKEKRMTKFKSSPYFDQVGVSDRKTTIKTKRNTSGDTYFNDDATYKKASKKKKPASGMLMMRPGKNKPDNQK
jgi:hypothetical protein